MSCSTGAGSRIDVTLKLPQLQNFCKRDPDGYREDYDAQCRRLTAEIELLQLQQQQQQQYRSDVVVELIQFAAAVSSSSYKGAEATRVAQQLMSLVDTTTHSSGGSNNNDNNDNHTNDTAATALLGHSNNCHKDVRKACVSALILMRNKGAIAPLQLFIPFFRLMTAAVGDKNIRELLYRHLVNDLRNINKHKRDDTVNRAVQTFLHKTVQQSTTTGAGATANDDPSTTLAPKRAVDMVCELYRRRVWTDERTVAILASAVQSNHASVSTRAMRFFLNIEEKMAHDQQQQNEDEINKVSVDYHLHSRKTCKRARQTQRALKNKKRAEDKKNVSENWLDEQEHPAHDKGIEVAKKLYPAIELLRDPQGLAEFVFRRLRQSNNVKFESKMLMINFVTRLTGNHELLLLPLYPFLQKYMGGHQRDVTAVLAYTVQACHEYVPPDEIFGLLQAMAHNFITERCSEEQMAVGINTARAICARVPAVLLGSSSGSKRSSVTKDTTTTTTTTSDNDTNTAVVYMDMEAFARDLAGYCKHRDKSVATAAKAWTNFVREHHPALLQGKDRGMTGLALHRAQVRPSAYGQHVIATGVAGSDLLVEYEQAKRRRDAVVASNEDPSNHAKRSTGEEEDGDGDDDDVSGEWQDMPEDSGDDDDDDVSGEWEDVSEYSGDDDGDDDDGEEENEEAPPLVKLDSAKKVNADEDNGNSTDEEVENDAEEEEVEEDAEKEDGIVDKDPTIDLSKMTQEERERLKQEVSSTRVFSAADFVKMRKLVEREARAKRDPREAARRKRARARGEDFEALSDDEDDDDDSADGQEAWHVHGAVQPSDLMALATRKRQSKAEKLEKILAGRTKFEAKKREGGSTNIEKNRKKNFLMSKFSKDARTKGRGKDSLQQKKRERVLPSKHEAKKRRRKV